METDQTHPLVVWLDKKGLNVFRWAPENGLSKTTIYHMIGGREPSLRTLVGIEEKTNGEVTMRQCTDWWMSHPKEEKADD